MLTAYISLRLLAVGVLALPNDPMYGYPPMPTISYHFPNTTYMSTYQTSITYPMETSTPVYVSPIYQQPNQYPTGMQMHSDTPISYYTPPMGNTPPYQQPGMPVYTPMVSYATEIPYVTPSQTYQPVYQSYYPPPIYSPTYISSYYVSSYPSSYYPPTNMCPPSGLDINHPGAFALWTYAPGYCHLDNKPLWSTINYPFNVGPKPYHFIDNSVTPPVSDANKGDLIVKTCSSTIMAAQAYLRPTHGTPQYFLLFGDPNTDPVPQLTLHDNFTLVAGTGAEEGKVFLSYFGEHWLACPGGSNPYTNLTQYNVYWNPGPTSNCISFRIEVRNAQRACAC